MPEPVAALQLRRGPKTRHQHSMENKAMSTIEIVFLVFGALATVVFTVGYVRGARIAIATYDSDTVEVDDSGDVQNFWWQIAAAVATASIVIWLVGVIPEFIYVGPALAIFTATMNGVAFFLEKAPGASE